MLALTSSLPGQDVPGSQDVGTVQWGPIYVWLRATQAGVIQVFASSGYRSAFAQPVTLTPEEATRWAALLDQVGTGTAGSSSAAPDGGDDSRMVLASGDLVLQVEQGVASGAKLRVWVGASRADALYAVVVPEAASDGARLLRAAVQMAHGVQAAAAAPSTSSPMPVREVAIATPTAAPVPPPAAPAMARQLGQAPATPVVHVPRASSPSFVTTTSTTTTVAFEGPAVEAPRLAHAHASTLRTVTTTTRTTPMHVAAPRLATVTTVDAAPAFGGGRRPHDGAHAPGLASPAVHHEAAADDGPRGVDDAAVQNLVGQWRPELMYCYTQYGLREHADLTGTLVVRVALSPSGSVGHSVIGSHNWNGDGGTDVESCIRARVAAWHFPPASAGSIHTFSLEFAPGRG